jgi:hypothetical protein
MTEDESGHLLVIPSLLDPKILTVAGIAGSSPYPQPEWAFLKLLTNFLRTS